MKHTCQLLRFGRSFSVFQVFKRLKNGPLRFSDYYFFFFFFYLFIFFFIFMFVNYVQRHERQFGGPVRYISSHHYYYYY